MKVSCIIPAYNSQNILNLVQSLNSNVIRPFEIIIVDDASIEPLSVENENVKIIRNNINKGPSFSRNAGAKKAQGDILLFLDSDTSINDDLLERIVSFFSLNADIDILGGSYSDFISLANTATRYKTSYMKYIHNLSPHLANFVLGACVAVRKEKFIPWNPNLRFAEDTFWGHENVYVYHQKVYFDKELQIDHLKKYSFLSLIRNDFCIAAGMVNSYLYFLSKRRDEKFSHVSYSQIFALLFGPISIISFFMGEFALSFVFLLLWAFIIRKMVFDISKFSNLNIMMTFFMSFFNSVVHFLGIIWGTIKFFTA